MYICDVHAEADKDGRFVHKAKLFFLIYTFNVSFVKPFFSCWIPEDMYSRQFYSFSYSLSSIIPYSNTLDLCIVFKKPYATNIYYLG